MNQAEINYRYQKILFWFGVKAHEFPDFVKGMSAVELKMFTEINDLESNDALVIALKTGLYATEAEYQQELDSSWSKVIDQVALGLKERRSSLQLYNIMDSG